MPKEWHKEIHDYFEALFSKIRGFIENEPEYRNYVPDMFKFPYLVLSFRCTDGYVAAAYPSGIADNYIHMEQNQSVDSVLHSLPNLILGTANHLVIGAPQWSGSGRYEVIADRVDTNRGPLPTTGWKFLHVATKNHHWTVKEAREAANEFISIFKARSFLYDAQNGGGFIQHYDRIAMRQEILDHLHSILDQYKNIINEKNYKERFIHRFLKDHPILLFPTKKRLLYEYPLVVEKKLKHKIDFIVELTTGRYILIELENPNHEIFTKLGDYSAIVNHAERQVEDWIYFLRNNLQSIEKELPGIIAPEGVVIIGRSNSLTTEQQERMRIHNEKHSIKLYTYDNLAEEAENHIAHILNT